MSYLQHTGRFFASKWRVWLPPVILTTIIYVVFLLFADGQNLSKFTYKIF